MLQHKTIQQIGKAAQHRVDMGTVVRSRNNDRAYSFRLLPCIPYGDTFLIVLKWRISNGSRQKI